MATMKASRKNQREALVNCSKIQPPVAMENFFTYLPVAIGMADVLVPQRTPNRIRALPERMRRTTRMPSRF